MVHKQVVARLDILLLAVARLGLEWIPGDENRWDCSQYLKEGEVNPTPSEPQAGIVQMPGGGSVLGFKRSAAKIGVFGHEPLTLAWDEFHDGFGLTSIIGENGKYLAVAVALAEVDLFCDENNYLSRMSVRSDGSLIIRLISKETTNMTPRPEIIIDVSPTGETKIEVEGCTGPACESLTKAFERELGTTVSSERKAEFHKPVVQGQKITQNNG